MLVHDETSHLMRVRGDNNRTRWFSEDCFELSRGHTPVLVKWSFGDSVTDALNGWDERNNLVHVVFELSSGEERWCIFVTPDYLKNLLEPRSDPDGWGGAYEPGIYGSNFVIVRDLKNETVDWMLRYMHQRGKLVEHSEAVNEVPE